MLILNHYSLIIHTFVYMYNTIVIVMFWLYYEYFLYYYLGNYFQEILPNYSKLKNKLQAKIKYTMYNGTGKKRLVTKSKKSLPINYKCFFFFFMHIWSLNQNLLIYYNINYIVQLFFHIIKILIRNSSKY